jgi:methylated-DNA-[protein]-cysteine S-methyltransferase
LHFWLPKCCAIANLADVPLQISQFKSPIGVINLIADEQILLGLNFSSIKAIKDGLDEVDFAKGFKEVSKVAVISDLLSDYFAGDIDAINGIVVRQPGAQFSQAAWKAMRKVKAGKTLSYADLADRAGSTAAVRAAGITAGVPVARIGRFIAGEGVVVRDASGAALSLPQGGWSHF